MPYAKALYHMIYFPVALSLLICTPASTQTDHVYQVRRLPADFDVDGQWDKDEWSNHPIALIANYMGDRPEHFPAVEARIGYTDRAIYVIFRVEDRYVRAVSRKHQDGVYKDSCVEFFFSPETHSDNGYFNLEMNCGGTMLFHHQIKPRGDRALLVDADLALVQVASSLPRIVEPEIQKDTIWTVEYSIPFDMLQRYRAMEAPEPGTIWRANLYKCADDTSHPHWLTWAPVGRPRPDFHVPEFFGHLVFE